MREVVERVDDVRLLVVGRTVDVEEYKGFEKLVVANGLQEKIVCCGVQNDMQRFYRNSDMLVMTSPFEGFPNVMAEAMSCSLPIVMYALPYLELVQGNDGVCSVPQRDTHMAAQKIIEILTHDEIRYSMGRASREAIEPYLERDIGKDWMEAFNSIEV